MSDSNGAPGGPLNMLEEGVRIALTAIRVNRIRTGLTILGVAIGVAVVVTMAALITGIRSSVLEAFESAGEENLIVTRFDMTEVRIVTDGSGRPPWWNKPKITPLEADRIGRLPAIREAIVDFDMSLSISYAGRRVRGVQASGNSAGWTGYTIGDFSAGRNFIPAEVDQARGVLVISSALAEELFGSLDPIGKRVRISSGRRGVNELFTVIGVFDIGDNVFSDVVEHFAILPFTAALKRLKADDMFFQVLVVPEEGVPPATVEDQIISLLRTLRGLGPQEENNFAILRSAQLVELFNQLTGVFFIVMLALSSVGLMVGGVGVIGIMLISVTERTREIGVRKAVGATRREILWQFLVEAGVLTFLGGSVGMILGAVAAEAVERATPIPASIPLWSILAALTMALLTGMLFGLLPAVRASRLDPVDALRYE
ncbi:MAG: ABC transporter permease [Gemmatimonadetes bacterium]|nr:ABC transporter permease [Gemmatimonadota bacterium]